MKNDDTVDQGSDHRICNRLTLKRILLVELEDGFVIRGRSRDVSPRGALMEAENPPGDVAPGTAGTLFLLSEDGQFSDGYPCRVVRIQGRVVALEVDKSAAAAFGDHITRDLLGS